jgi:hypothetical protein
MKIRLDKITITQVEVEMPDACPHCGEDWRGEAIEDQLVVASETGYGFDQVAESGIIFEDQSDQETFYDAGFYITGYTCAFCAMVIVTSEATGELNQNQEKLQGV